MNALIEALASNIQFGIIRELETQPRYPSELEKLLNEDARLIDRQILNLERQGIVYCALQSKDGSIYALNPIAKNLLNLLSAAYKRLPVVEVANEQCI